ncbi:MAG: glycosyltransferase [Demequinaceae bacterium]|nr:glycosyltransferase [Demequinaceae bacterium]
MTEDVVPEVSVVIAALNAERTLGGQLAALSRQEVSFPWEIVVCDNGSTDGTVRLVRTWQERLPQLRVVDASARRGPGAARNVGAAAASAPLLLFCDADDVVADDWLREMHSALRGEKFVTGNSRRPEFNSRPGAPVYFDFSTYRTRIFPQLPVAGAGNMGVHKSAFDEVGGFDYSLRTGEDLDLCWRLQLAGYRLTVQRAAVVNVSNREGLGASFRQAYAYGVGDKRLRHKYARVIRAFAGLDPLPVATDLAKPPPAAARLGAPHGPSPRSPRAALRRIMVKVVSIRRPSDLTNLVHKVGTALGYRFGSIDKTVPQLIPPRSVSAVGR